MGKWRTIDEYIYQFPDEVAERLREIKKVIREEAPEAIEAFKYGIPTYILKGNLVHFAAFKKHIGLYPTPSTIKAFKKDLTGFTTSEGTIQFLNEKPLPIKLIREIVKHRVKEVKNSGGK